MIYITGDTHGRIDIRKLSSAGLARAGVEPTGEDYLIVCGDFGLVFHWQGQTPEERYWLDWLGRKPFAKVLFVDGNHENFDRLSSFPVEEWNGGLVHRVTDSVFHLMRGCVFEVDGRRFLTMGGARSVDRAWRKEGKTWWPQEMPGEDDLRRAERSLDSCGRKVDFVVTHCAPTTIQRRIDGSFEPDVLTDYLDRVRREVDFERWFFGHYHVDVDFPGGFTALYDRILPLDV